MPTRPRPLLLHCPRMHLHQPSSSRRISPLPSVIALYSGQSFIQHFSTAILTRSHSNENVISLCNIIRNGYCIIIFKWIFWKKKCQKGKLNFSPFMKKKKSRESIVRVAKASLIIDVLPTANTQGGIDKPGQRDCQLMCVCVYKVFINFQLEKRQKPSLLSYFRQRFFMWIKIL